MLINVVNPAPGQSTAEPPSTRRLRFCIKKCPARDEGIEEGRAQERTEMARNLKALGVDIAMIAKASGLYEEEIAKL